MGKIVLVKKYNIFYGFLFSNWCNSKSFLFCIKSYDHSRTPRYIDVRQIFGDLGCVNIYFLRDLCRRNVLFSFFFHQFYIRQIPGKSAQGRLRHFIRLFWYISAHTSYIIWYFAKVHYFLRLTTQYRKTLIEIKQNNENQCKFCSFP